MRELHCICQSFFWHIYIYICFATHSQFRKHISSTYLSQSCVWMHSQPASSTREEENVFECERETKVKCVAGGSVTSSNFLVHLIWKLRVWRVIAIHKDSSGYTHLPTYLFAIHLSWSFGLTRSTPLSITLYSWLTVWTRTEVNIGSWRHHRYIHMYALIIQIQTLWLDRFIAQNQLR